MCRFRWLQTKSYSGLGESHILQLIRSFPLDSKYLFATAKHLEPMNGDAVLVAPRGLGWDVSITKCCAARRGGWEIEGKSAYEKSESRHF
jgi:hypothetical protein